MARTVIRRIDSPRKQKRMDGLSLTVAGLVAIFALIGLVSAGTFVAGKFSSSSSTSNSGKNLAVSDVARAQAQATAIVGAANAASRQLINTATSNSRRRAAGILAAAQRQAHQIVQQAKSRAAQIVPTPVPAPAYTAPVYTAPTYSAPVYTAPTASSASSNNGLPSNLKSMPASWMVIAYSPTFGGGPGSAGGVSVYNRGTHSFSGGVVVQYARGGSASASFTGIQPGQVLVLPLNGPAYPGGNWHLSLVNLH